MPAYTDLILARDLQTPIAPAEWPAGFKGVTVDSIADPGFPRLDRFCTDHGFPDGWVGKMLESGRRAWMVLVQDNASHEETVAASGWIELGSLFIDEIKRTFDARPDGVYLFGDLVAEAWRGRKLQRLLIRARAAAGLPLGRRWAYAITRNDNAASLKNYTREGFGVATAIDVRFVGPLRLDHHRRPTPTLSTGGLSTRGRWLPLGWRISRR